MKEILAGLNKELLLKDFAENFKKQTNELMPGDWKVVGIQVYIVEEEQDILASPGIYSKGFDKSDFEEEVFDKEIPCEEIK